ncbi:hypothetical protein FSP39_000264 [Pinctada imbricata]|uniref:Uncharacterized protein n=1 Tax=Pinctada imbricata TaxID=66713 RepID=A0AA88XWA5_PINIB|nr:hypothetical protein FSP39_000264 [Pinctada imbricata]
MSAEDLEGRFASTLFERLQPHSLSRYSLGQNCNALDGGDVISVERIGNSTKTPTQDLDRENVISFAMNAENTTANETDEGCVGDYINGNRKDNGIFDSSGVDSDWMEARLCVEDILNQIEEEADITIELNGSSVSTLRQQQMKTWDEDSVNPAVAGISPANAIEENRDIYATNMIKPKVMNEVSVAKPTAERTGIISAYVEVEKRKENGIVDSTGDKNTSLDMRNSDIVDKGNGIYNLPSTEIPILKRESTFKEKCGLETMDKIEYDTFYENDQTDITQREVSPVSAMDFDMLNVKFCMDSMLNEVSRRLFKEKLKEMISDTMCGPSSTKYADETLHWKTSGLSRDMTSQQLSLKLDDLDFPSNQSLFDGYKIPETPRPNGPYMTEMKEDEIAKNSICTEEPFIFSKGLKLSWTPESSVINVPTMKDDSSESDVSISPPIRSVRKYSFTEAIRNSSPLGYFREQHSPFRFTLEYFEQFREWEECGYVPELPLRRPDLERVILHEILEQSPWERREVTPPPLSPLTIDSTYMFTYDRSDEESENEETCLKEASLKSSSAESAVGWNQAKYQDYKRHAMIDENVTGTSTDHGLDEDKAHVPTIMDSTKDKEAPRRKLEISAKVSLPILPCKPKILKEDNGESKPLRFTEKKGLSTLMTLPSKPVITTTSKMPIVKPAQQTPTRPTERKQKLMIDEIDKLVETLPKLSKNVEMKPSNWKNRSQCKVDKLGEIFGLRENIKAPSRIPIRSTGHENGRTQQMETKVPLEEKQVIKGPVSPEVDIIKSQQEPGVTERFQGSGYQVHLVKRMAKPSDCKVNGAEAIPGKEKHKHIETIIDRATTKSGNGLSESISESLPKGSRPNSSQQQSRTNSTQINGDDQQIEKGNEFRKSADHERAEKRGERPLTPVQDTGQFIQAQDNLTEGTITSLTMLENTHQSGKGNVQNESQECEMLIDKIQEEGSLLNIEKSKPRKSASSAMSRPAKNASSEIHKIVKLFDNVFEGKETLISHEDQAKRGKTESKVKNRKDTIGRMRVKSEPRPTERMSPGNKPDSNPQQSPKRFYYSEPFSVKAVPDNGPLPPIRDRIIPVVKGTDNIQIRSNRKLPSLVDNSIHNRPPWNASTKVKTEWEEERSRRNKKIKTGSAQSKPEEPLPTLLISKQSKYKPLPEISKSDDYKLNLTGHLNGISREHGHLEGRNNLNQLPALPSIGSRLETRKDKKNALKNGKNAGSASGCLDSGGITNVKGRKKHGPSTSSSNINKTGSNATKNEGETKSKGTGQQSNTANKNENNRRTKSRYTVAVSCLSETVKSADSPRKSRSSSVSSVLADNTMDKPPSRISSSSSSVPAEDRSVSTTPSIWYRAPSRGKLILSPDLGNYSAKIYRPDAKDGDGEKSVGYYRDNVDKNGNGLGRDESKSRQTLLSWKESIIVHPVWSLHSKVYQLSGHRLVGEQNAIKDKIFHQYTPKRHDITETVIVKFIDMFLY